MLRPVRTVFLLSVIVGLLHSCYYDNAEDLYQNYPTGCDVTAMSFSQDINPIINQNCVGCHGATAPSAGLSLTTYTQVKQAVDNGKLPNRINRQQGDPLVMPPGGPMIKCSVDKINAWISQGALDN